MTVDLDLYNSMAAGGELPGAGGDGHAGEEGDDTLIDLDVVDVDNEARKAAGNALGEAALDEANKPEKLKKVYADFILMASPGRLASQLYGPTMQDPDYLATGWIAHVVRAEAADQNNAGSYTQDAKDTNKIRREFGEILGGSYFQKAIKAVSKRECTAAQLELVLNELHPVLAEKYAFHGAPRRDRLPFLRDSGITRGPSEEVKQAHRAIQYFALKLPYAEQLPKRGKFGLRAVARVAAETELYRMTEVFGAPEAIRQARYARLVTMFDSPKAHNDVPEHLSGTDRMKLPAQVGEIYEQALKYGPKPKPRYW